jgi:ribose transport system substrate-binding protein
MPRLSQNLSVTALLALAACVVAGAAGCNKEVSSSTGAKLRIAVIPKGATHTYWVAVKAGAERAGQEKGVEIVWKAPPTEGNADAQIGIVEDMVTHGVSGICLAPCDEKSLLDPVQSAAQKKIPVLIFDSALKGQVGKDFISLVATDNRKAGDTAGEELARLLGNKGKVVLLRYMVGHASTTDRETGFLDAMARHPDIQIIEKEHYAGDTADKAQTASMEMADHLKQADGVFTPNESATEGMLNALVDLGLAGKVKFVGFDATPALVDALQKDQIQALVTQDPQKMGYEAVSVMVDSIKGKKVPEVEDTGSALVTKANLNDPAIKKMIGP